MKTSNVHLPLKELLLAHNIVKKGHFILRSGLHSNSYIFKDLAYARPETFKQTVSEMTMAVKESGLEFDIVVSPPVAGVVLGAAVAMALGVGIVFPRKVQGSISYMTFNPEAKEILQGKRILIVEDIITTGGSVERVWGAIRAQEGRVVGVTALWEREDCSQLFKDITYIPLIQDRVESFSAGQCPTCKLEDR